MEFSWVKPGPNQVLADFTALSSFTTIDSLLKGVAKQPVLKAGFFDKAGRSFKYRAWGVLGSTGTPTFQFSGRLKSTVGVTEVDGASVGQSAAITTQSGVTNTFWEYNLTLTCRVPGQGSGGLTLNCQGSVRGTGLASPFEYILVPTTGTPQTWTVATGLQNDVDMFFNLCCTCGTSNASNTIQCKGHEWFYY